MAAKRRRLTDLYVIGEEVTFDDGSGDPITVFVRKLNPVDHQTALKRANGARARVLAVKRNKDSEDYLAERGEVDDLDLDSLVAYLLAEERANVTPGIEAELAAEDEWTDDGYLEGLRDAWQDHLKDKYAEDPEDPEAKRVLDEIKRFNAKVDEVVQERLDDVRDEYERRPVETLRDTVFNKTLEMQASLAWLDEYRTCEVWLSTCESDKKTRYFESRDEVDGLPNTIFKRLQETYQQLAVEPAEGKG